VTRGPLKINGDSKYSTDGHWHTFSPPCMLRPEDNTQDNRQKDDG